MASCLGCPLSEPRSETAAVSSSQVESTIVVSPGDWHPIKRMPAGPPWVWEACPCWKGSVGFLEAPQEWGTLAGARVALAYADLLLEPSLPTPRPPLQQTAAVTPCHSEPASVSPVYLSFLFSFLVLGSNPGPCESELVLCTKLPQPLPHSSVWLPALCHLPSSGTCLPGPSSLLSFRVLLLIPERAPLNPSWALHTPFPLPGLPPPPLGLPPTASTHSPALGTLWSQPHLVSS